MEREETRPVIGPRQEGHHPSGLARLHGQMLERFLAAPGDIEPGLCPHAIGIDLIAQEV